MASEACNMVWSGFQPGSGRETFIAMMKSANLWKGDDLVLAGRLSRAGLRAILAERQMSPCSVVIVEIRPQDPP